MSNTNDNPFQAGDFVIIHRDIKDSYGEIWHHDGDELEVKYIASDGQGLMFGSNLGIHWSEVSNPIITMKTLTTENDLEKILTECLNEKWTLDCDPLKLRISFTNNNLIYSVRLASLRAKPLSKELWDRLESAIALWQAEQNAKPLVFILKDGVKTLIFDSKKPPEFAHESTRTIDDSSGIFEDKSWRIGEQEVQDGDLVIYRQNGHPSYLIVNSNALDNLIEISEE